jgi:hypothetical protein
MSDDTYLHQKHEDTFIKPETDNLYGAGSLVTFRKEYIEQKIWELEFPENNEVKG